MKYYYLELICPDGLEQLCTHNWTQPPTLETTALEQSDDYIQGSHLLQSINRVLRMN